MPARRSVALLLTTPGWRGSAVSFLKIAAGLRRRGHRVVVIAGTEEVAARFAAGSGHAVDLVPTGDTGLREVRAVRRVLRSAGVEVVIADSPRDVRIARYASLWTARKIVWRYNLSERDVARDALQRFLFGRLDAVVQQSVFGVRRLASGMSWCRASGKTWMVPNGYDTAWHAPDIEAGRRFRAMRDIPVEAPLVLTAGSLFVNKGTASVGAALAGTGAIWIVAGEGPERPRIAEGAASDVRVIFVGEMAPAELRDAMRAADLVIQPSRVEIFPNVIAEAMATGCAVIGADAGAAPEVIGDAGVTLPFHEPHAARAAIKSLLDDRGRRQALGARARARVIEHFPLAAMEDRYDALVSAVAEGRIPGPG